MLKAVFLRHLDREHSDSVSHGYFRSSKLPAKALRLFGGRTRTRTWDPLIKSQLLYQLSYAPEMPPAKAPQGLGPVAKRVPTVQRRLPWTCVNLLGVPQDSPLRSSPRKRGPSPGPWIPAFAGMSGVLCVASNDLRGSESVAVLDQRRTSPLRFALRRIRDRQSRHPFHNRAT